MNYKDFIIGAEETIEAAMIKINANQRRTVLVLNNDNVVLGAVADGDIRRALLDGTILLSPVNKIMNTDYIFLNIEEDNFEKIKDKFNYREGSINILPAINSEKKLIKIYLKDEKGKIFNLEFS